MRMINRAILVSALLGLAVTPGFAKKPAPAKASAAVKCPVCHMALSSKKTAMNGTPVKIKGKTMYCCNACDMKGKPKKK